MRDPYLSALEDLEDLRRAPVETGSARARIREQFSPEQATIFEDDSRFIVVRTERGAGKTTTVIGQKLDRLCDAALPPARIVYGALTKESARENVWDEIKRQNARCGLGLELKDATMVVTHPETGGRLRIFSLETKREVDKQRGKQYTDVVIDECQSIVDDWLRYAIISVIPPALRRFRGRVAFLGTATKFTAGFWYTISSKKGMVPREFASGDLRAITRPWSERKLSGWRGVDHTWSLHTWPASANPALSDADREAAEMRERLAITAEDKAGLDAEYGDWPEEGIDDGREYRFDEVRDVWQRGPTSRDNPFGLPEGHVWSYYLGADLAFRRDDFALTLGATARTSRTAYHADEFHKKRMTIAEMAVQINRYRDILGPQLVAIVGDSQGPTGQEIFVELSRVHRIPIERATKGYREDGLQLVNSDFVAEHMKILKGSELARQLGSLRKGPDGKRLRGQADDVADAWTYTRKRMMHWASVERSPDDRPSTEQVRRDFEREQLRRMTDAHKRMRDDAGGGWPRLGGQRDFERVPQVRFVED
jgi:hypothetical protein